MSTKHTPGPWFVGETLSTRGACIVGDGDSVVCEFDGRHGETVEADARLIAAAPDLLAACMAEQLAIVYDDDPGSHEASEAIRELITLGYAEDSDKTPGEFASSLRRIAIAKATGEQA